MAPKASAAKSDSERVYLGRPSNNLKIGIVGMPNVGKSSLFNALTNSSTAAENYPFCTIDPSEARCSVPDERFDWLCNLYKPASKIPAFLTVVDIAGLVKGASEGQGLGNAFLSHIRAVDGIFHVVRAFENEEIAHVEGDVDPIRDLQIIHDELRLKDVEFLTKKKGELERKGATRGVKEVKAEYDAVCKALNIVDEKKVDVRFGDWNAREAEELIPMQLLTAKPVIYLVNVSQDDYIRKKNKWLAKIKAWIDEREVYETKPPIIPFSGELELKLSIMPADERAQFLQQLNTTSVLPKIIVTGYKALNLIYFFTAGEDEVRAWTIRANTKAPQAAGVIHTDFERGFIMAEVMAYNDLKEGGSEAAVKAAGKYKQKGKDYEMQDGDICYFKFNVTTQPKKK